MEQFPAPSGADSGVKNFPLKRPVTPDSRMRAGSSFCKINPECTCPPVFSPETQIKGGERMSKKTIETIREAEVKADAIRADAVRRASEMQAQAEADGKRLCEETEKNTAVALKQMMAEMQIKADELKKRSDEQTGADAEALRADAEKKKRGAVKYILRGITG